MNEIGTSSEDMIEKYFGENSFFSDVIDYNLKDKKIHNVDIKLKYLI